jgi:hypothetical protein
MSHQLGIYVLTWVPWCLGIIWMYACVCPGRRSCSKVEILVTAVSFSLIFWYQWEREQEWRESGGGTWNQWWTETVEGWAVQGENKHLKKHGKISCHICQNVILPHHLTDGINFQGPWEGFPLTAFKNVALVCYCSIVQLSADSVWTTSFCQKS